MPAPFSPVLKCFVYILKTLWNLNQPSNVTSSNTFQSDIGSFQNGAGHGEDIIKARFLY